MKMRDSYNKESVEVSDHEWLAKLYKNEGNCLTTRREIFGNRPIDTLFCEYCPINMRMCTVDSAKKAAKEALDREIYNILEGG